MRIPGAKKARLGARWLRSRFGDRALILGYHRIADERLDPYSLCVRPDVFESQLETLRRLAQPIDMTTLVEDLKSGRLRKAAVHLTFDDGYSEILDVVEPLLRQYEIPATVFVSTGSLGGEFWWDRLERLIFGSVHVQEIVELWSARSGRPVSSTNDGTRVAAEEDRAVIMRSIYQSLLRRPAEDRDQVLDEIEALVADGHAGGVAARSLKPAELSELSSSEFIHIGSHTVTHPLLPDLLPSAQREEIRQSKVELERMLGTRVDAFSYPNGSCSDDTVRLVRESGYQCACTSLNDVVRSGSDRFRLPRFWPGNRFDRSFESWITRWIR